jgi:hypothetical protein
MVFRKASGSLEHACGAANAIRVSYGMRRASARVPQINLSQIVRNCHTEWMHEHQPQVCNRAEGMIYES